MVRIHRLIVPALVALLLATLLQTIGIAAAPPASAAPCPCSLFAPSDTPDTASSADTYPAEVGMNFTVDTAGYISAIRFYKGVENTGIHTGHLWDDEHNLLSSVTFTNETASGWQQAAFSTPVEVETGIVYTVSYFAPKGRYAATESFFGSTHDNAPLHASAVNGIFRQPAKSPDYPHEFSDTSTNYWVDVVFEENAGTADVTAPLVHLPTPSNNSTNFPIADTPTITFTESMDAETIDEDSVYLTDPSNNNVPAAITYDPAQNAAVVNPWAPLSSNTTYTLHVISADDAAGNALTGSFTSTFTTETMTLGPSNTEYDLFGSTVPANPSINETEPVTLGVTFDVAVDGYVTGVRFYKGASNTGTHTGQLWNEQKDLVAQGTFTNETATGWQTLTFDSPVFLNAGDIYTASYHAPNGGYAHQASVFDEDFVSGPLRVRAPHNGRYKYGVDPVHPQSVYNHTNYFVSPVFKAVGPADEISLFEGEVPRVLSDSDTDSVNLGTKFFAANDGYVQGVRFYKTASNTGTHTGTLWSSTGTQLATGTFINETSDGWQTLRFEQAVEIDKHTEYVVSYLAPNGRYAASSNYFQDGPRQRGSLVAPKSVDGSGNGVYAYDTGTTFPTSSFQSSNYFVEPIFTLAENDETTGAPNAAFDASRDGMSLAVNFDASDSQAQGSATLASYAWDFGDGSIASGLTTTHTYASAGTYTVTLTVTDSNNLTDIETQVVEVDYAPPTASFTTTTTGGNAPLDVTFDASGSTAIPGASIVEYQWVFGDGGTASGPNPSHTYITPGVYSAMLFVVDSNGNAASSAATIIVQDPNGAPPVLNPPAIDPATSPATSELLEFLYEGPNAIQVGVDIEQMEEERVGLVRGRVLDDDNDPLTNVVISVKDHPEYGETRSRADGKFDMVINGGGAVTFEYRKVGFLSVDRTANISWNGSQVLDDVTMIEVDDEATEVELSAVPSGDFAIAESSVTTDTDGTRQSVLAIPSGTTAELVMPDGSTVPADELTIRATEYTVGEDGPERMPAELPPSSGYTYAVELSADEAIAAGAKSIEFSQPLYNYVDNFIGFPIGTAVPAGYYDADLAAWIPSDNGVVAKLVGVTGGVGDIDVTGDGVADTGTTLSDIGITTAEATKLADLYDIGDEFWRVPIKHFTPWDYNWPFGLPFGAIGPDGETQGGDDQNPDCKKPGSIIKCQSRSIGEVVPISGTSLALHYDSEAVPGRVAERSVNVPVTSTTGLDGLKRVEVEFCVQGNCERRTFTNAPNQSTDFMWNGLDAFGRPADGRVEATVTISNVYEATYRQPADFERSFGTVGGAVIAGDRASSEIVLTSTSTHQLRNNVLGVRDFGGWQIEGHHGWDAAKGLLKMSDGRVSVPVASINSVTGTGASSSTPQDMFNRVGQPATEQTWLQAESIVTSPGGEVYVQTSRAIFKIDQAGIWRAVTGTWANPTYAPQEGVPAIGTPAGLITDVALSPSGEVYFGTFCSIRKIDRNGIITTFAGVHNDCQTSGDGGHRSQARLDGVDKLSFDSWGNLYVVTEGATGYKIRKIDVDGTVTHLAGAGLGDEAGDNGPAAAAIIGYVRDLAVSPSGEVFYGDDRVVRKIGRDGIISRVAGSGDVIFEEGGSPTFEGDTESGYATDVDLVPQGLGFDSRGTLYISNTSWVEGIDREYGYRVQMLTADGRVRTVAGGSREYRQAPYRGEGALTAQLSPGSIAALPNGDLLVLNVGSRIEQVDQSGSSSNSNSLVVPSPDGKELYLIEDGRHAQTLEAMTGAVVDVFQYDSDGDLISVSDGDGNTTTFTPNTNGTTTVTSPYGQQSTLDFDGQGNLERVENALDENYEFTYAPGGLLNSFVDPRGGQTTMSYDTLGRLVQEQGPEGGSVTLATSTDATGNTVTHTTAEGRVTSYRTETRIDNTIRQVVTDPAGAQTQTVFGLDGTVTVTDPTGRKTVGINGPDPRWGMAAPLPSTLKSTTPAGLEKVATFSREITLTDPNDRLSIATLTDSSSVNGKTSTVVYNRAANTVTETTPEGRTSVTTLDPKGRAVFVERNGVEPVAYTYDNRGRLSSSTTGTGPSARTSTITYGLDGLAETMTDALGRVMSYDDRDPIGRPLSVTAPGGRTTLFDYSAGGDLAGITPPGRPEHTMEYDDRGLVTDYHAPLSADWTYEYNDDWAQTTTDRPGGTEVATTYDGAGRVDLVDLGVPTVDYGYDTLNRLSTLATSDGTNLAFGYDGDLPVVESFSGTNTASIERIFDNHFRVASDTVSGGGQVNYSYDNDGALAVVGPLFINRDANNGRVDGVDVDNLEESVTYTPFGEVDTYTVLNGSTQLYVVDLAHDKGGRITQSIETVGSTTTTTDYLYDTAGRLQTVTVNGTPTATYTYDANGNRITRSANSTTETATTNDRDQLTAYGNATYSYLASGERASKTVGSNTTTYTYDSAGTLRGVDLPNTSNDVEYVIDGQGRRAGKKVGGTLTQSFLYDGNLHPVAEYNASGNLVSRFVYGTNPNTPDLVIKAGTTYRVISDERGSIRLVVNASTGAVAQQLTYDEYGRITQDTNPGFQPFGYAGGIHDNDTGLVHFGAREYDPQTGTWTSQDPIGFSGGDTNLYAYVANDPINNIDPTGLIVEQAIEIYTIVDSGWDLYQAIRSGCDYSTEATAFGLNLASVLIPGVMGAGAIWKAGTKARAADNLADASRFNKQADTAPTACPMNSFTPDTDVVMADGTKKDIDDIDLGDEVLATNELTGETKPKKVTRLIEGFGTKTLVDIEVNGNVITATDHHPFWANNTWTDAIDLKSGDVLHLDNGTTTTVDEVNTRVVYEQRVNNLTVADFHTYYVSFGQQNVLVHNTGCKGPGDSPIWKNFDAAKGKTKTNGLTGKDRRFFEWDYTHNDIEVYDRRGRHLGTMDPLTGELIKDAVAGRTIKL
jgi:RHS repeat-associated protein